MTAQPDDDPTLVAALTLARLGYRVLPIKPGDKRPPMPAWQEAATCDEDIVHKWFTGLYRNHGLGIATGRWRDDWLFVVDVDEHGHISGGDTLDDLEDTHGELPTTVEALTGSGGRHLYFTAPTAIRNDAGKRIGQGIDIRGDGGQVLAPPTLHPNGNHYEWVIGQEPWTMEPVPAPVWLLTMLTAERTPTTPPPDTPRVRDEFLGAGPIDRFNASTTWADILTRDGWVASFTDAKGETHWTRPGKSEGTSATTGWNGQDFLRVFTTSIGWLPEGSYSKIQYVAARDHRGDVREALRAVSGRSTGILTATTADPATDDDGTSWEDRDLSAWLDGEGDDVVPTMLERTDGQALLYPARINLAFGESGSGKTWVALNAAVQMLNAQRHVAYVDLEDHPRTMVRRLLALGATRDSIARYFHYKQPHVANRQFAIEAMEELVNTVHAELVIVDSYGEALALFGVDQNDDHGVATFTQAVLRPWTRMGIGVLLLDHIPKSEEGPKLFAIGSQRKRAAVDGVAYRVNQVKAFGKGVDGKMTIVSAKDRGGTFPLGATVAEVEVQTTPDGSQIRLVMNAPQGRDEQGRPMRPTSLMEKVSRYLETQVGGQVTRADIRKNVKGKDEYTLKAIDILVEEGFIVALDVTLANRKPGTVYVSHRAFRAAQDAENGLYNLTAFPAFPQRSRDTGTVTQPPERASVPSVPPPIQKGERGNADSGLSEGQRSHSVPDEEGWLNEWF